MAGLRDKLANLQPIITRFKRNRPAVAGLILSIFFTIVAIFAPYLAPQGYAEQNMERRLEAPTEEFFFGTDAFGRCLFSRVIYGTRTSLMIGLFATILALIIGAVLGIAAGYWGGTVDIILMRITDMMMSVPSVFLIIVFVAIFGASLRNTILVIGLTRWTAVARLARAEVMSVKNEEFLEAAHAIGGGAWHIIVKHVVPNVLAPIIVWASLFLGQAVLTEAGLSYLGLGAQPPLPSWGNMVSDGQDFIRVAWWQATIPGAAIFFTVLAFNLAGDGVRDALDPKVQQD